MLYFHVFDVRTIFEEGLSGYFKVHRDYLYQMRTFKSEAFANRELASVADPERERDQLEHTLLTATDQAVFGKKATL